jgi:hypothetical protein
MHLTNYSLNKRSSDFNHNMSNDDGSKRAMSSTLVSLLGNEQYEKTWQEIIELVSTTLEIMHPVLKEKGQTAAMEYSNCNESKEKETSSKNVNRFLDGQNFQIFGFDVMLDEKCNPYLLEVNNNPSMNIDGVHVVIESKKKNEEEKLIEKWIANVTDQKEEKLIETAETINESKTTDECNVSNGSKVIPSVHGGKSSRYNNKQRDGVCRCMDSHEPHVHYSNPVDVWIKSIVLKGALQIVTRKKNINMEDGSFLESFMLVCENFNTLPEKPWYNVVPCDVNGGVLGRVGDVYRLLVGKKRKMDGYKWRKFCGVLIESIWLQTYGKKDRKDDTKKEFFRNELRKAEDLYRSMKMNGMESSNITCFGVMEFIVLVVSWLNDVVTRVDEDDDSISILSLLMNGCDAFEKSK